MFKAKATLLTTCGVSGIWIFLTELTGSAAEFLDPNTSGDGFAMAGKAGAELTLMERSGGGVPSGFSWPPYGSGKAHNTWYACTIVDATGKEVPWADRDGKVLKSVSERYHPAPGQKWFDHDGPAHMFYEARGPRLIPDLPSMPEHERRAIFGLMVGNEGKTRIPVYDVYTKAGFDPDKDMLQATMLPPDRYHFLPWWFGVGPPQWRGTGFGGGSIVVDWDLKTNIEGLYAAGDQVGSIGCAAACAQGRYAGRKATAYAKTAADSVIDRKQVEGEKTRVYAPVRRKDGIAWKELYAGSARVMQDHCGEHKSDGVLSIGLEWLNSIRESEAAQTYARNPHELWRTLECFSRITVSEIIVGCPHF